MSLEQQSLCWVVNLPQRKDRRKSIIQTFQKERHLPFEFVSPVPHPKGSVSLWKTIQQITMKMNAESMYILCEDDHVFTEHFNFEVFSEAIKESQKLDADILLGGVSWFKTAVQVSKNLFWIEKFSGLQFTVIFKRIYERILATPADQGIQADFALSALAQNKFLIHPFISEQKDFGYSDVTAKNDQERRVERLFMESSERLDMLKTIKLHYSSNLKIPPKNSVENIILNVFNLFQRQDDEALRMKFLSRPEFNFIQSEVSFHGENLHQNWQYITSIVEQAFVNEEDLIVFCTSNVAFKAEYSIEYLAQQIMTAYSSGCNILLGNLESFNHAVQIADNLFWIDSFSHSSFFILFRRVFKKILDIKLTSEDKNVFSILSYITSQKMVVYPLIASSDKNILLEGDYQENKNQLATYNSKNILYS